MVAATKKGDWREALEQAIRVGARIKARRGGKPLTPPPEEIIRQMREERSERFDELEALLDYGDQQVRKLCTERGLDWDGLSEDERQQLIDELLHEVNDKPLAYAPPSQ